MKNSIYDKWMTIFFYTFVAVFAIACLYPFLLVLASSITDEAVLLRDGYKLFPNELSISAYQAIFTTSTIPRAYLVTIFVTLVGTFLSLVITSMAAYALSGRRLYYAPHIAMFFYFTMLF